MGDHSLSEKYPEIEGCHEEQVSREEEETAELLSASAISSDTQIPSNSGEDPQGPLDSDGASITLGGELNAPDSKTEDFPSKDYITMTAAAFGVITLFSFLLKFTSLGLRFSKKKRKKNKIIESQMQEILSGQSGRSKSLYMPYGPQNY